MKMRPCWGDHNLCSEAFRSQEIHVGLPISGLIPGTDSRIQVNDTLDGVITDLCRCYAAARRNDSHTKPTISRAQATLTLFGCLPATNNRLPFLVSRRKHRSAMATNSGADCARRALIS